MDITLTGLALQFVTGASPHPRADFFVPAKLVNRP
jgi:hypothetical protein